MTQEREAFEAWYAARTQGDNRPWVGTRGEMFAAWQARASLAKPAQADQATAEAALTPEDRTRALNLAYHFRSHPASLSIDEIEQAGEIILSLLAALQPEAPPQWLPIETAPMDGTVVVLFGDAIWPAGIAPVQKDERNVVGEGYFSGGNWQFRGMIGRPRMWRRQHAAPSAQAEPIAALVGESERLGLYDVPPLADLREKLGGWDVPEVSGKQAEQGGK